MNIWKRKLAAFLHDPPHKPARIQSHEDERALFLKRFGLTNEDMTAFEQSNDWQAAAADRLIFPNPAHSGLRVDWGENWLEFQHPLGGTSLTPSSFPVSAAALDEMLTSALDSVRPDANAWRQKYLLAWRLWPERTARRRNGHFAYLVADTRIPDHTLWHHNALAAAFTACEGKPAFLMFQIGPVQEFIAQARKTQDLWSASYLLSFLIAQGMLAVADAIGPDSIVFPQLRGLPLADFHWSKAGFWGGQKLRASHANELLVPNLPNRFLALVPGHRAEKLALAAERAVRNTWDEITSKVKNFLDRQVKNTCPGWDMHWKAQVNRFPIVDWVVHLWPDTDQALNLAETGTPPLHGGWKNHPLNFALRWAEEFIPQNDRGSFRPRSNFGFAWALHFAATDWKFAARKNARAFDQWQAVGNLEASGIPKDHLDGRNEVLGGAKHTLFWSTLREKCPQQFKGSQLYGALSVIKRLWADEYLRDRLELESGRPVFQPVNEIAQIDAAIDAQSEEAERYYAVLAMDGDDMGQWVSGCKAAPLLNSLAPQAQEYFRKHWAQTGQGLPQADEVLRPLSPGYHAALSEALANFSLYCARPIVEAFEGQIIYAGGDDVLAMTPASTALDCAQALQLAFRGIPPDSLEAHASKRVKSVLERIFVFTTDPSKHPIGFLTLRKGEGAGVGRAEHLKPNWPLMMMGPKATVSVGIAIGHVHSPMQDIIQAAREAEAVAKKVPDKGAFALKVFKRSGEAVGFSARWQDSVVAVWGKLNADVHDLSGRFAHRYASLIKALVIIGGGPDGASYAPMWDESLKESVEAELRHVLQRQGGVESDKARELATLWCGVLSTALSPRDYLHFWLTWAFIHRLGNPDSAS